MQIEESLMKSSTALARLDREMQNEEEIHPRMLARRTLSDRDLFGSSEQAKEGSRLLSRVE
jgi:hypothetical protein